MRSRVNYIDCPVCGNGYDPVFGYCENHVTCESCGEEFLAPEPHETCDDPEWTYRGLMSWEVAE